MANVQPLAPLTIAGLLAVISPALPREADGRLTHAAYLGAPGGWQSRVLSATLHGRAVGVKLMSAHVDSRAAAAGEEDPDEAQTDAGIAAAWEREAGALHQLGGVHGGQLAPTLYSTGQGVLGELVAGFPAAPAPNTAWAGQPLFWIVMAKRRGTADDYTLAAHLRNLVGMVRSLEALHAAGWAHGEVHRGNFVSDFAPETPDGVPAFQLIDLGNAVGGQERDGTSQQVDVYHFCGRVILPHFQLTEFASPAALLAASSLVQLCWEGGFPPGQSRVEDLDDAASDRDVCTAMALRKRLVKVLTVFLESVQL